MTDNPLAPLGDLTKPATVLIERISDAVGGLFRPYQLVRVAKAEAEAEVIRAQAQIQITDLQRRAVNRFFQEEATRQHNMEDITSRALPQLTAAAAPENISKDWLTNFFDRARITSDEDMQLLWSRVLAGEANAPGAFARRTVNILADLDKADAELFARLCGFAWVIGNLVPLVHTPDHTIYEEHGIRFDSLSHLESLGLVQFQAIAGFQRRRLPKQIRVFYFGTPLDLVLPNESNNNLELGCVLLTRAGQELAPVSGAAPVDGFFEFVRDRWASKSLTLTPETRPDTEARAE